MVAWNRAADTAYGPYAVCALPYRMGLGWQVPTSVPSLQAGVDGQDAYGSSVAMSSAGAVLGWSEIYNGSNYRPFARIWNPSTGAWSAAAWDFMISACWVSNCICSRKRLTRASMGAPDFETAWVGRAEATASGRAGVTARGARCAGRSMPQYV